MRTVFFWAVVQRPFHPISTTIRATYYLKTRRRGGTTLEPMPKGSPMFGPPPSGYSSSLDGSYSHTHNVSPCTTPFLQNSTFSPHCSEARSLQSSMVIPQEVQKSLSGLQDFQNLSHQLCQHLSSNRGVSHLLQSSGPPRPLMAAPSPAHWPPCSVRSTLLLLCGPAQKPAWPSGLGLCLNAYYNI